MKKSRFSEEQILAVLKERESGTAISEICRKHGISEPTYHSWKKRYGGMNVDELRRLKELEAENSRLKKMYSNLSLELDAAKDLLSKKY